MKISAQLGFGFPWAPRLHPGPIARGVACFRVGSGIQAGALGCAPWVVPELRGLHFCAGQGCQERAPKTRTTAAATANNLRVLCHVRGKNFAAAAAKKAVVIFASHHKRYIQAGVRRKVRRVGLPGRSVEFWGAQGRWSAGVAMGIRSFRTISQDMKMVDLHEALRILLPCWEFLLALSTNPIKILGLVSGLNGRFIRLHGLARTLRLAFGGPGRPSAVLLLPEPRWPAMALMA